MNTTLHFIVARSRMGWSVSLESDRLCDHMSAEKARECAAAQTELARRDGARASLVDLSRSCSP
jgi:hypothetical protein